LSLSRRSFPVARSLSTLMAFEFPGGIDPDLLGKRNGRGDGVDHDDLKRLKTDGLNPPSKVLHVRNLPPDATEPELFQLGSQYGSVVRVLLLQKTRQGFVQFTNQSEASAMLEYASQVPIIFRTKQVFVQYSNRTEIRSTHTIDSGGSTDGWTDGPVNRILLLTVSNVLYPITVDVLTQVFAGYGTLEKIVIFVKGAGVQALVQFADLASSASAKKLLDGQNIYSGCCHLKIQYSTLQELTVKFNNNKTRDFTQDLPQGRDDGGAFPAAAQLGAMQLGGGSPFMPGPHGGGMMYGGGSPYGEMGLAPAGNSVVLVNHLDPTRATLDVIFNLFSTCGIVHRIKILFAKRDTALVQFATPEAADTARTVLTGCPLHGLSLLVSPSKHPSLQGKADTDGGANLFGDYTASNMHRFKAAGRVQAAPPSRVLHVSNLAADTSDETLVNLFRPFGPISDIKWILPKNSVAGINDRKMALISAPTVEQAVEALVTLHNTQLNDLRVRVSFSTSANSR